MHSAFKHIQAAHCESGVTNSLLRNAGIDKMTEPLAFGIGSGLFYVYVPFLKINGGPAIAFRSFPGIIFKQTCQSLGIPVIRKKFRSREAAQTFLDQRLAEDRAVGCQVGVYYLPYFPKEYRFHFNAHNLIVYEKEKDHYLVSDPIMETVASLSEYELERVRFAKGALAPRGQIYYPSTQGLTVDDATMKKAIRHGIKKNVFNMLRIPGQIVGVKGIGFTGRKIKKWRDGLGLTKAGLYLAQLVRMQEEIGTGGGGFRYIYAAFLQEAYEFHRIDELQLMSAEFTRAGDRWR
ncbi:MAG TPA: BtrH N-terminal domain-containing protein, partial [Puia sp.]|nr:BtrH N-terminal domain-containing protein [Puia sp.]